MNLGSIDAKLHSSMAIVMDVRFVVTDGLLRFVDHHIQSQSFQHLSERSLRSLLCPADACGAEPETAWFYDMKSKSRSGQPRWRPHCTGCKKPTHHLRAVQLYAGVSSIRQKTAGDLQCQIETSKQHVPTRKSSATSGPASATNAKVLKPF